MYDEKAELQAVVYSEATEEQIKDWTEQGYLDDLTSLYVLADVLVGNPLDDWQEVQAAAMGLFDDMYENGVWEDDIWEEEE